MAAEDPFARLVDVVDRSWGKVVRKSFRADGAWIWSDAATYYLENHRLRPDPALLQHVRDMCHVPPFVNHVTGTGDDRPADSDGHRNRSR